MNERTRKNESPVYGGIWGTASALIVFFLMILILSILNIRGSKAFWSAGVVAMVVSFFSFKDKDLFQQAVKDGIKDDVFIMTLLAFFFAGILSQMLTAGHLVDSLMWVASKINLSPSLLPVITFVICVIISTASGTSSGTVATVGPILLPVAASMGCRVELVCGAIASGAFFGDNLAPISDTTIASALTQEVPMVRVVRARMKYAFVCGAIAAAGFIFFGFRTTEAIAAKSFAMDAAASNLVFLICPVLVVALMVRGKNLLTSLMMADLLGGILLLATRNASISDLFSASGIIANGISGMAGATNLIMFAFIVSNIARTSGFIDIVMAAVQRYARSPRSSEIIVAAFVCLLVLVTGSPTASIAIAGPVARQLLRPMHIDRARSANVLDGLGCAVGGLVPHCTTTAMIATLAVSSGVTANQGFSVLDFVMYNFHCIALFIVFWFAVLSGWGRRFETKEELEADGVTY